MGEGLKNLRLWTLQSGAVPLLIAPAGPLPGRLAVYCIVWMNSSALAMDAFMSAIRLAISN
jgi:hypothetical protein